MTALAERIAGALRAREPRECPLERYAREAQVRAARVQARRVQVARERTTAATLRS